MARIVVNRPKEAEKFGRIGLISAFEAHGPQMNRILRTLLVPAALAAATAVQAQPGPLERLPVDVLDAMAPSERVSGAPGRIAVEDGACRNLPREQVRRRIVDLAIQEWGYFGFTTVDETAPGYENRRRRQPGEPRRRRVDPEEAARVVHSIAGYWSVTPDGSWILDRQNRIWRASSGALERWRDPWSAAFISWVMCEGGLSESTEFQRAIAHYVYIDQAIEARDGKFSEAAFVAHEVGETAVEPGDLLCRGRRGSYSTVAERREDLGEGTRSHCDVVVKLDAENDRILVIGGNVRSSVRLKFLPARLDTDGPADVYASIGRGSRAVFAHLKLQAPAIGNDAFETSPTIKALSADPGSLRSLQQRLVENSQPAATRSASQPAGGG